MRRPRSILAAAASAAVVAALLPLGAAAAADDPVPGAETITVPIGDDVAGGSRQMAFKKVFTGYTPEPQKTPVYIYLPADAVDADGNIHSEGVLGLDPNEDPTEGDEFVPCGDETFADHQITPKQITDIGNLLAGQIVAVDEAHFGEMDAAGSDPASDSLVMLVYNVFDDAYYDCAADSYTAGYFAPDFITSSGMNVIVIDSYDWANRTGEANPLYEGVVAHELEHLLMNYSDSGELSWVDEGLADMASFLNNFGATGSHVLYHQVFHRETSLTRWGGGLENYGSSYTFFQYLWEQAGGNGDGSYKPNFKGHPTSGYDGKAGDLLIKYIFEEPADGMAGVQAAIDRFNRETGSKLRGVDQLFQDWAAMTYIDDETSALFDLKAIDYGLDTRGYTVSVANEKYWKKRGQYNGTTPEARLDNSGRSPVKVALPFGASYEEFTRRVGDKVRFEFTGKPTTTIAAHSGDKHWYGGYQSMSDTILDVDSAVSGGAKVDFWTWYFIEEGWDYGFVEALVPDRNGDGQADWVTVPASDDSGTVVTTDTNPYGNNTEGNGLTGTSGGAYFVDEPTYVQLSATLPAGATDVRFRYSTDAAYLDTGWFIDDVTVNGAPATLSSDDWAETSGAQINSWAVQVLSRCELSKGETAVKKVHDGKWWVYQWKSDPKSGALTTDTLNTSCMGSKDRFVLVVSNMPSGALSFLDATYDYRVARVKG